MPSSHYNKRHQQFSKWESFLFRFKDLKRGLLKSTLISTIVGAIIIFSTITAMQVMALEELNENFLVEKVSTTKQFSKSLTKHQLRSIDERRREFNNNKTLELKQNVKEAHTLAQSLYRKYKNKMSRKELEDLIITTIKELRSTQMSSHVFISTLDGYGVYYKGNPEQKGKNLLDLQDSAGNYFARDQKNLLSKQCCGYIHYDYEYDDKESHREGYEYMTAYIMSFPEMNWYFGARCFPGDYYTEFENEIMHTAMGSSYAFDGQSFIIEGTGRIISSSRAPLISPIELGANAGRNPQEKEEYQEHFNKALENAAKKPNGTFHEMVAPDAEGKRSNRIAYSIYYPPCDWYVGTSFSMSQIEAELFERKEVLIRQMRQAIFIIIIVLIFIIIVEILLAAPIRLQINHDFTLFTTFFKRAQITYDNIDVHTLTLEETKSLASVSNEMITSLQRTFKKLKKEEEKAQKSDKLKSAFLANLSHEIRTPMNAIVGFSELLEEEDIEPEDRHMLTEQVKKSSNDLLELIDNIINVAKLEAGDISVEKNYINLLDVIKDADQYAQNRIEISKKDIKLKLLFTPECNSYIHTDQNRLSQALHHILDNAVKFTEKGEITLSVENQKNRVYFQIKDTGIGISPENTELIFKHFTQVAEGQDSMANNLSRLHQGVGIGLSICRNIIRALGGDIWVDSKINEGSIFQFYIKSKDEV